MKCLNTYGCNREKRAKSPFCCDDCQQVYMGTKNRLPFRKRQENDRTAQIVNSLAVQYYGQIETRGSKKGVKRGRYNIEYVTEEHKRELTRNRVKKYRMKNKAM